MNGQLDAVWGSGPNDVWAVGGGNGNGPTNGFGPSTIVHWNGAVWSSTFWSAPQGDSTVLGGVWGSGPDDVWAVGAASVAPIGNGPASPSMILHWDGKAWSPVNSGTSSGLTSVWGSGPTDVWAVGAASYQGSQPVSTIVHWDGSKWATVPCPTSQPLNAVWGSGPNDVWAVSGFQAGRVIIHWDGTAWSVSFSSDPGGPPFPPPHPSFMSVWGSGPSDVWTVSDDGSIMHWGGSGWSNSASATANALYAIWGNGSADVWAVGAAACADGLSCPATILHH